MTKKYFEVPSQTPPEYRIFKNSRRIVSEDYIIYTHFPQWKKEMVKRYGLQSDLITEQNCIEDWITLNSAWEIIEPLDQVRLSK